MKAVRWVPTVIAALAVAAVLVPASGASSRAGGAPALPTLYVQYTMNCTFGIFDDQGRPVTSIAPGNYQVEVETPVMFKLVRPGGVSTDNIAPNDFTGARQPVHALRVRQVAGTGVPGSRVRTLRR